MIRGETSGPDPYTLAYVRMYTYVCVGLTPIPLRESALFGSGSAGLR